MARYSCRGRSSTLARGDNNLTHRNPVPGHLAPRPEDGKPMARGGYHRQPQGRTSLAGVAAPHHGSPPKLIPTRWPFGSMPDCCWRSGRRRDLLSQSGSPQSLNGHAAWQAERGISRPTRGEERATSCCLPSPPAQHPMSSTLHPWRGLMTGQGPKTRLERGCNDEWSVKPREAESTA